MTAGADRAQLGLADTSLFIAMEQERPLRGSPPMLLAVSVITITELRLGVLAAGDGPTRARRLETLTRADGLDPIPVDGAVAAQAVSSQPRWRAQSARLAARPKLVGGPT